MWISRTPALLARGADRVAGEPVQQRGLRSVEPERALHRDPVQDHAEELGDLPGRDVRAEAPARLPRLDPAAASLAGVLGRDRSAPELRVGSQPSTELEVDGEPVRVVPQQRVEERLEALLGEQVEEALVVPCRQREEELLLRAEPVEDRTAERPISCSRRTTVAPS